MARPKLDFERIIRELPTANDYLEDKYGKQGTPEREEFSKNIVFLLWRNDKRKAQRKTFSTTIISRPN